jgi:hypothetical protein
MPIAVRRFALPVIGAALAAACIGPADTNQANIPDGAIIFKIAPQLLTDEYIDTTAGNQFGLTWLSSQGFIGYNCFGLSPTTPTDTTGTFVFGRAGPNTGRLERRNHGVTDTVPGYFIDTQAPGTHGTYVVDASGKLTLTWVDGARTRYFAPSATLRLYTDTIESTADLRAKADSIRDQWHVYWTNSPTCP